MYNEERKRKFIAEFTDSISRRKIAYDAFDIVAKHEEDKSADICTWDKEELQEVLENLIGLRASSGKTRLSIFKGYIKWCINQKIEGARSDLLYINIKDFGLEQVRHCMVANPQHLQRYMDCFFDKEVKQTMDCTMRCYYWLAYAGMNQLDIIKVRAEDVCLDSMTVKYEGKEYPIFRESIYAFSNCVKLQEFCVFRANDVMVKQRKGDTLLRGTNGDRNDVIFRGQISRDTRNPRFMTREEMHKRGLDLKLSYYKVWLSGLFYRMYEAERAGVPVDFKAVAAQNTKCQKKDIIEIRALASEYLRDYNRWKEAFSI